LVRFVLNQRPGRFHVTTGAKNLPAIRLYERLGFELAWRFETPDGVAMVAYLRDPSTGRAPDDAAGA
jgi:RimJ/RimL family protein N-acetyltransferase